MCECTHIFIQHVINYEFLSHTRNKRGNEADQSKVFLVD